MAEARLDVLLVMAPENIVYTAGVLPPSLRTVRTRLACCVIPAEGSTELIVVALEKGAVEPECWLDAVTPYREFEQDAVSVAAASLRERGLSAASIGIEETYLPKAAFEVLQASLPDARFVAIDGLLADARCIKTQDEIDSIASIGRVAQTIGEECLGLVSAGDTERALGTLISERYAETGGRLTMLVVGSGARSAIPNAAPTDRILERGDTVRIDVIGTRDNYCSDVARTAVVGEPTMEQQALYGTLKEVHERILERLRPGALTSDLYSIYRDAMEDAGLPYYHFVGHGLGITLHEDPFINDGRPVMLAPNMVICIEPMTLIEGRQGMQIEDEVLITSDGCRLLTEAGDLLRIEA
jgi:Xaa-Pro dipeptidase